MRGVIGGGAPAVAGEGDGVVDVLVADGARGGGSTVAGVVDVLGVGSDVVLVGVDVVFVVAVDVLGVGIDAVGVDGAAADVVAAERLGGQRGAAGVVAAAAGGAVPPPPLPPSPPPPLGLLAAVSRSWTLKTSQVEMSTGRCRGCCGCLEQWDAGEAPLRDRRPIRRTCRSSAARFQVD